MFWYNNHPWLWLYLYGFHASKESIIAALMCFTMAGLESVTWESRSWVDQSDLEPHRVLLRPPESLPVLLWNIFSSEIFPVWNIFSSPPGCCGCSGSPSARPPSAPTAEWRPLIGPNPARYCALIGWDYDPVYSFAYTEAAPVPWRHNERQAMLSWTLY